MYCTLKYIRRIHNNTLCFVYYIPAYFFFDSILILNVWQKSYAFLRTRRYRYGGKTNTTTWFWGRSMYLHDNVSLSAYCGRFYHQNHFRIDYQYTQCIASSRFFPFFLVFIACGIYCVYCLRPKMCTPPHT